VNSVWTLKRTERNIKSNSRRRRGHAGLFFFMAANSAGWHWANQAEPTQAVLLLLLSALRPFVHSLQPRCRCTRRMQNHTSAFFFPQVSPTPDPKYKEKKLLCMTCASSNFLGSFSFSDRRRRHRFVMTSGVKYLKRKSEETRRKEGKRRAFIPFVHQLGLSWLPFLSVQFRYFLRKMLARTHARTQTDRQTDTL